MSAYLSEFLGTMLLILLGDGVCCAVSLNKSKAQNSGWTKLGVFCTAPAIKDTPFNFISEFIGTFVLVFTILGVGNTTSVDGFGPFIVGLIILVIGLSLGATTGYAINPARDLGPRIAHAILPIKDKGDSDWGYAWLPVIAPICGGICAALIFTLLF